MNLLDWLVLVIYLVGMLGLSLVIGRKHTSTIDYYLAGRRMSGTKIGCSMVATQISAVSLIGAPAFIALKPDGGLRWLQYELAVPLAMAVIILIFVPRLVTLKITTLFEYIECRFGNRAGQVMGGVFLVSRGLGTAVAMYATAIVVSACLGISIGWALIILAIVTIAYTTIGGIEADIYSDIVQLIIITLGTSLALGIGLNLLQESGGILSAWHSVDKTRLQILDFSHFGFKEGETFAFWPMVIGGFFLYVSYYGCDQSQAQRLFTASSPREASFALLLNGLLRFPLVLLYCAFGVVLLLVLSRDPQFAERIPAANPDYLVPYFILEYMPHGAIGLMMAAVLAAAMSTFDSVFNSLSAVTRQMFSHHERSLNTDSLGASRAYTLGWGVACTAIAYYMGQSEATVIELINMVGSAFYGPILAIYLLGLFTKTVSETGAINGLLAGVGTNAMLYLAAPNVSWLWWNVTGSAVAVLVGSVTGQKIDRHSTKPENPMPPCKGHVLLLMAATCVLFGILLLADKLL